MDKGVEGHIVQGKSVNVMGNRLGEPLHLVKGVFKRKNGTLMPYFITVLIDGSGFMVNFGTGEFPAVLFKTEDMNREAERVFDLEIEKRRGTSADFDAKYQYYQQKKAQEVLGRMFENRRRKNV